jgi:hypothetical protein
MDVGVAGSAWTYQTTLYYNSTLRRNGGLELQELLRLTRLARKAVGRNRELVKSPRDNMPPEAKLMYDVCNRPLGNNSDPCKEYFEARNGIRGDTTGACMHYRYPEFAVYETCPYRRTPNLAGFLRDNKTWVCPTLPLEELRRLKLSEEFRYDILPLDESVPRAERTGLEVNPPLY